MTKRFLHKANYILDTKTGKEYFYLSQCVSLLNDLDSEATHETKWKSARDFFSSLKKDR